MQKKNRGAQIQQRRRAKYAALRGKVVDWVEDGASVEPTLAPQKIWE
jgi:hypothetical protein